MYGLKDLNKDNIIDENDREVIGNPEPIAFGSFSNRITWKQFTLDAFFTFVTGNDVYNYTRNQLEAMFADLITRHRELLNRCGEQTGM